MTKSEGFAVIFDMDGVLIDSYSAHLNNWLQLGRELGYPYTEADFLRDFGRTSREVLTDEWAKKVPGLTAQRIHELDQRKEALFRDLVRENFPAMDGGRELIATLEAAGIPLAVGSSGPPENVELAIEKLGIATIIRARVTGSDVTRGKPDPQVFLFAAERLGVSPSECVVIEDARAGIRAAHAAGMKVVALVSTGHTREEQSEADLVVDSLRELTVDRLRRLVRS